MLNQVIVTADRMRAIESLMFAAGMPVAALMEKVAGLIAQRLAEIYPIAAYRRVGILVGSGHNGGDALVVARELWHRGREVKIYSTLTKHKPLTRVHRCYAQSLGIPFVDLEELKTCDLIVDGLFGFGLERNIEGELAGIIDKVNTWGIPILSIDLPSGIHTDTGAVMGVAIRATHTLCLGLWKRGLFAESTLSYFGQVDRLDFDIPESMVRQVLGDAHAEWRIDPKQIFRHPSQSSRGNPASSCLPIPRAITTHKYQVGHLLLIVGSQTYGGAALLAALGAKASGVGMLTIAVPESLRSMVLAQVPDALVMGCPETDTGAIAGLPELDLQKYQAIACGCGLSLETKAIVDRVLRAPCPLVLDADGLTLLASLGIEHLKVRSQATILTPHWGEFGRLFPELKLEDRLTAVQRAVSQTGATILLKGARTAISFCDRLATSSLEGSEHQQTWVNPESTPALARGGSGDVLAGVIGGLLAQGMTGGNAAIAGTVWHSQTAIWLAKQRTEMGVDPLALAQNLLSFLAERSG
ncbi:NAD(P)H-hydrate dehydratase [Tumidithrix helvetica PCC 7403]|uniref:NAD(P)H-hydrate dehydratase n=1 Tax=Tumidithrix helvetica TaxID=3457545 RepID=UPI003CAA50FC